MHRISLHRIQKTGRTARFLGASLALALLLGGCTQMPAGAASLDDKISDTSFFLDTVVTVTLYQKDAKPLIEECFTLMNDYENMLSRTREGSDVWNINHSGGEPVTVSEETAGLIEKALHYAGLSGGAFDPTIAPVVSLWDFQGEGEHTLPDENELSEALTHVGYENVELDGTTVTLKDPDASIDLGGIAKGYIADRLKDYLTSQGVECGLIDLGGNILTIGRRPDGKEFTIGIRRPFASAADLIETVTVDGRSVVTSGTYERYFEKDGVLYHHILNPEDGYPFDNGLTSVTILSDQSVDGDALSTTCFTLGLEDGMELVESLDGIDAMFITEDMELHKSSGFPE